MKITRLVLKNIGLHKHLDHRFQGSLIGILGPNGSGKSLLLQMIQFLLTNYLADKQESYVNADVLKTQKDVKAYAKMEFIIDGKTATIVRQILPHAARKLTYDGKSYTKVEDIRQVLHEIMGTDDYTINNAVFPRQGDLDKILSGTQTEREELFIKLLLVGHLQKISEILAVKASNLSKELQDYSLLHDQLHSQFVEAEEKLAKATHERAHTHSWVEEHKILSAYLQAEANCISTAERRKRAKQDSLDHYALIQKIIAQFNERHSTTCTGINDIQNYIDREQIAVQGIELQVQNFSAYKQIKNKIIKLNDLQHELDQDIGKVLASLDIPGSQTNDNNYAHTALESEIRTCTNFLDVWKKRLELFMLRETLSNNLDNCRRRDDETKNNWDKLRATEASIEENKKQIQEELNNLHPVLALAEATLSFKDIFEHNHASSCPLCGEEANAQKLHAKVLEAQNKVKGYRASVDQNTSKLNALNKLSSDLSARHGVLQQETAEIQRQIENLILERKNLQASEEYKNIENITKEEIETHIAKLEETIQKYKNALTEFQLLLHKKNNIEDRLLPDLKEALAALAVPDVSINFDNLQLEIDKLNKQIEHSKIILNQVVSLQHAYDHNKKIFEQETQKLKTEQTDLEAQRNSFTPELIEVANEIGLNEELLKNLELRKSKYTEETGILREMYTQAETAKKRIKEMEIRLAVDEKRKDIIKNLRKLSDTFSRHGIPMAYVTHKFNALIEHTQSFLEEMEANFIIRPHPTKKVSIQFCRTDIEQQSFIDQDKLSGGQKVRFGIAILLALQELIIPDLGLLVLDEPSLHLDTEGKETLRELLTKLKIKLGHTDTQLIVCDHAQELETSFDHILKL